MKKLLIILICCLAGVARAENVVSVSSASGHPQDEVTLNVSLANTDEAVAFQADIPLGSQLTYVMGSVALNSERATDHIVTAAVVNGSLKILAYSITLSPFVGNEGTLLSFTLRLKNESGNYTLDMGSAKLSDASGTALPVTTQNGTVTILSPKLQINTTTLNYGHVPIRSDYYQTASVTNVGNEPLTITSITFSDAVFSCPDFTETIMQPGEYASFNFKFAPMLKGGVTATATIISNSISGNGIINLVADPFAVNEIHVGNTTGYCDSVVALPISMNNMEGIIGFQIEFNLNPALEFVDFTLSDRKTNHVATGVVSGTTLRLMAYSPSGATFTGDDGVIGTVRFLLKGMYGYYSLYPTKAVLADANGEDVLSDKYEGYVDIRSPQIYGDDMLDFGTSPVTETANREYVVNNWGNASMRIDQIVFDQEGFAVAEAFPITVPEWESSVLHVSYTREQKGNFNALMKIYSNDPQNGLKNVALSGSRYEPNSLELFADPFSLENGDVAVSLLMDNYSDIVALQANFQYPHESFSVQPYDFQLTERFSNHLLYSSSINDSTYRIIVLSMQNNAVEGHEGVVLNITLHPIGTPEAKEYTVSVSDIVLSGREGMNLFTGEFDPCEFHFFTVPMDFHFTTAGTWSKTSNWQYNTLPRDCDRVFIDANCQLDMDAEVTELSVTLGKTLTLQTGKTLTVIGSLTNTAATGLVIKEGAQLINASANVSATMEKNIVAYGNMNTPDGWYAIASPMDAMPIEGSTFLTPEYDLYRYNENSTNSHEWENHKMSHADFTSFENGRGYLYANNNTFSPAFIGTLNNTAITCPLSYSDRPNDELDGFNLIGNPFPHVIYKGAGAAIDNANLASGYYTLTNEGAWHVHTYEEAIQPGQGILVKATAPTALTIAKSNAAANAESDDTKDIATRISFIVTDGHGKDCAIVYFGQGTSLDKVNFPSNDTPMIAIVQEGKDYAIAHIDNKEIIDLKFKGKQSGKYVLRTNFKADDLESLRLTDHATGTEIDLLQQLEYNFTVIGQEPEIRFTVTFK